MSADGPKPREVFAADFRDRIVHHLLVSRLERAFEPAFIHDSYACRKGNGRTLASCETRLRRFARRQLRSQWGGGALRLDTERNPGALPAFRATLAWASAGSGVAERRT